MGVAVVPAGTPATPFSLGGRIGDKVNHMVGPAALHIALCKV